MAAEDHCLLARARERPPLVPGRVEALHRTGALELRRHPLLRALPRVRPGDPLGAVLVAGQLAQLAQLGDGAGRGQRHAAILTATLNSHRRSVVRNSRVERRSGPSGRRRPSRGRTVRAEERRALVPRPDRALLALGGVQVVRRAGRADPAVPGERADDAPRPRHGRPAVRAVAAERPAADRRPPRRRPLHRQGGRSRVPARRRRRLRDRRRALRVEAAAARLPPLHRRLADGPDPRDRADGGRSG